VDEVRLHAGRKSLNDVTDALGIEGVEHALLHPLSDHFGEDRPEQVLPDGDDPPEQGLVLRLQQ
jgi:hypothetical protein